MLSKRISPIPWNTTAFIFCLLKNHSRKFITSVTVGFGGQAGHPLHCLGLSRAHKTLFPGRRLSSAASLPRNLRRLFPQRCTSRLGKMRNRPLASGCLRGLLDVSTRCCSLSFRCHELASFFFFRFGCERE